MSEWLDIRTHEDHAAGQERILNSDTGETRVIPPDEWPEGLGPSSAVPLESMIEAMGGVDIVKADRGWFAMPTDMLGNRPLDFGWPANPEPTVKAAIEALYAAWRERE